MIKLLLWAVIVYLLYRTLKNWVRTALGPVDRDAVPGTPERIDDLMLQDPYCEVYFPKKEGHHLRFGGEDLYFCSPECREKFLKEKTTGGNE